MLKNFNSLLKISKLAQIKKIVVADSLNYIFVEIIIELHFNYLIIIHLILTIHLYLLLTTLPFQNSNLNYKEQFH